VRAAELQWLATINKHEHLTAVASRSQLPVANISMTFLSQEHCG
jgi:hypothetical protein